jgi:hypothetical protein
MVTCHESSLIVDIAMLLAEGRESPLVSDGSPLITKSERDLTIDCAMPLEGHGSPLAVIGEPFCQSWEPSHQEILEA